MFYHIELSDKRNEYLNDLLKGRECARTSYVFSPARKLSPENIAELQDNSIVYGGMQNKEIIDLCTKKQITYYNFLADSEFAVKNARLTAEALLPDLISCHDKSIYEYRILLLGAGRVAQATARLLTKLGLQFIVCTFDKKEHMFALLYCDNVIHGNELSDNIKDFDTIINTIPAPVLTNIADHIEKGTVIIEVASAHCLGDITKRRQLCPLDITYIPAPALPSKYSAYSAAELMFDFIMSHRI